MRPKVITVATAAVVGVAAATIPVTLATSAPTAAPVVVQATSAGTDDTPTVCVDSAKIVTDGLNQFVGQLDTVKSAATAGNLSQADQSTKQAGATLTKVGTDLNTEAAKAADPHTQQAVTAMANQFTTLGGQLTGVAALPGFDTTQLQKIGDSISNVCGTTTPSAPALPSPEGS